MRRRSLLALFIFQSAFASPVPFESAPPLDSRSLTKALYPKVRVHVADTEKSASLRGLDLLWYRWRGKGWTAQQKLLARTQNQSNWKVQCEKGWVIATDLASGKKIRQKELLSLESQAGLVRLEGTPYWESLDIYAQGDRCEWVNEVGIEKYLQGLVNAEFSSRWDPESVAAQVIAARTYALYQIRQAELFGNRYHVESTVKDQVYPGGGGEDFPAAKAVRRTQGIVLATHEKAGFEPIKAFYHSTCGGRTELPQAVWGKSQRGFQQRVPCRYCQSSPRYRWTVQIDSQDLLTRLQKSSKKVRNLAGALPVSEDLRVMQVNVIRSPQSWRVSQVELTWQEPHSRKRGTIRLPATEFRNLVGTTQLKSTRFELQPASDGKSLKVAGVGYGHGVGMCQWGAKVMGEQGKEFREILKYYYPNAILAKLW